MSVLYTNNATTTLASTITSGATTLSVASGTGIEFPSISNGDFYYVTLSNANGLNEIVKVTARSVDTMTIVRGQDGTSALAWVAGDKVELRVTKGLLDQLKIDAVNGYVQLDSDATFDSIQFNGGTGTQGTMSWNSDEETVDLIQDGATLQLGQELQTHCRNNTASSIPNATVVMATGTLGASGRITVAPWDGTTDVKFIVGITTEVIEAGTDGKVTTFGKVRDVDTSLIAGTFTTGVIYASTSVAGGLTYDKPTTKAIPLAFLIANETAGPANNGTIMVRVTPVNEVTLDHAETAYGWGNHASAGYASATALSSHTSNTSNPHSVTKTQVGLGNVDNTSDVNKPVSTAQAASIATKVTANSAITAGTGTKITYDTKGLVTSSTTLSASDIPSLDASKITSGTIDSARLPSYVDDVIEGASLASFPTTGETGKIYVALDTNKTYRWSGSAYVYITSGAVDSVAGKTGVVTLVKGDVGLGSVDNTSDLNKPVSTATQTALNLKADSSTVSSHTGNTSNPHSVTKAQVGLTNVEDKSSATIRGEITSSNVTTALGYTPYNNTNPSGFISGINSGMVTTALGYTPQNSSTAITTSNIGSQSVSYASSAGNADTVDSLHVHTGRNNEANKVVRTDGNGYLQTGYINSSNGDEGNNSNPSRVWGTNGSDSYLRSYLTSALSVNYANSAGSVAASGITGQSGMWTSAARPGAYRLYRNDDNSAYNIQTSWSVDRSGYWSIRGYYNDTYHAACYVAYAGYADSAGSAGNADTLDGYHASSFLTSVPAATSSTYGGVKVSLSGTTLTITV